MINTSKKKTLSISRSFYMSSKRSLLWFCVPNMWYCHVVTISHLLITQLRQPLQTKQLSFWLNVRGTAKCSVFRTDVNRSETNCLRCLYYIPNGRGYTLVLCVQKVWTICLIHTTQHTMCCQLLVHLTAVWRRVVLQVSHNICRPPSPWKPWKWQQALVPNHTQSHP